MTLEPNPRAVIGSNSASNMADAVSRFDLAGYMLARYETLALAVRDDRVDRACLKVLASLIATMNRETRTSWAGREIIASQTGMTVKSVSNYIYQLKCLGYVVSERRQTPQANNRVLMHYALAALSPEEIEAAISAAVLSIRGEVDTVVKFPSPQELKIGEFPSRQELVSESSRQDRNSLPVRTGTRAGTSRSSGNNIPAPTGTCDAAESESSRQDGHSIIENARGSKNTTSITNVEPRGEGGAGGEVAPPAPTTKAKRGTRLPDDWQLPKSWGNWALEHFIITRDQVLSEAASFKDHWHSTGRNATKLDWRATWRNWVRNSKKRYPVKKPEVEIAADLLTTSDNSDMLDQLAAARRVTEGDDG